MLTLQLIIFLVFDDNLFQKIVLESSMCTIWDVVLSICNSGYSNIVLSLTVYNINIYIYMYHVYRNVFLTTWSVGTHGQLGRYGQ